METYFVAAAQPDERGLKDYGNAGLYLSGQRGYLKVLHGKRVK